MIKLSIFTTQEISTGVPHHGPYVFFLESNDTKKFKEEIANQLKTGILNIDDWRMIFPVSNIVAIAYDEVCCSNYRSDCPHKPTGFKELTEQLEKEIKAQVRGNNLAAPQSGLQ